MAIYSNNIDDLYKQITRRVMHKGIQVTTRGLDFKEIRFEKFVLSNPRARLVQNPARKLQKRFAMGEFIWIMSGNPWLADIAYYNKRMSEFSDDGVSLNGAYGPRLRHWSLQHGDVDQLTNCMDRLKKDLFTRQAVMVILDPAIDFVKPTKDVPCNDLLHFMYRENKLDLMCYVRSNDLLLGFPYDVFHWTMLQEIFAKELKVELGNYYHIVGSMHIYNSDFEKMNAILKEPNVLNKPMNPMPEGTSLKILDDLKIAEKSLRTNILTEDLPLLDPYWGEFLSWCKKES